ncbi:MAG: sulfotransferase, partial [Anaerolineae bacterium]|nr:sulfotransferase [Anaerolineae bacterium]
MPYLGNVTSPIFVIGAGRSGTSWLMHVLGQHPDVRTLIENSIVKTLYREVFQAWWNDSWHWECDDDERERRAIRAVHAALSELFPDKSPRWAMKLIWQGHPWPFVYKTFPDARYIHITRSPTTAVLSMSEYLGKRNKAWHDLRYSENEYIAANKEALRVRNDGWPYLHIRQEDAVANPRSVWNKVIDFCGLADVPIAELDREINTAKSTAGKVKEQRPPLDWSYFSSETLQMCQEFGYLPGDLSTVPELKTSVSSTDPKKMLLVDHNEKPKNSNTHKHLEAQIVELYSQINAMKATKGWQMLEKYWVIRDRLKGSVRKLPFLRNGHSTTYSSETNSFSPVEESSSSAKNETRQHPVVIHQVREFSKEELGWIEQINKHQPTAIAIVPPEWRGVSSATSNLFNVTRFVEDTLTEADAQHLARLLSESGCKKFIFGGCALTYRYLAEAIRNTMPDAKIYLFWLGNFLQYWEKYEYLSFSLARQLYQDGLIYKWGFAKKGIAEIMANQGWHTSFLKSVVRQIPTAPSI